MVDSPSTVRGDLASAAEILSRADGIAWVYELLADVAARHRLSDAWLVVHPAPSAIGTGANVSTQVFGLGGRAVSPEVARTLLDRPSGVYGEPGGIEPGTNNALGAMCVAAFRASVAALGTAVDPTSGLSSRLVIDAAIARSAASASRYGWSSTLVLLTTGGDEPEGSRWLALAAALRQALRSGDEGGVTAPGVASALLGNAGPEAVRPFIARIRAGLSASGWDDVDLLAATARTPEETVDPVELKLLAAERLADAGSVIPGTERAGSTLELELRLLPGVVCVEMATPLVVMVSISAPDSLHESVLHAVRARLPHGAVRMLTLADGPAETSEARRTHDITVGFGKESTNGNGTTHAEEHTAPRAISAVGTRGGPQMSRGSRDDARVSLLGATFDPDRGSSEVSLGLDAARGTGRASAGPLAGGAQATLNALEALTLDVPFYLVSAERAHGVPGEPVVVVLAPKRARSEEAGGAVERLGVATGGDDVEAASRATLGALNRHLTRSRSTQ